MYKHILIATDGSDFSYKAAEHGLRLAKALGAKVTVFIATMPWNAIALSEIALGKDEKDYDARARRHGERCLAPVLLKAKELGVSCDAVQLSADRAYEAIMNAAKDYGCDAIVVGAHGRRGLTGLLIGSETTKLLTHSKVPVVVYRE